MSAEPIPEDRTVRDVEEELAITLDMRRYGNAYVRGEIPEWWGQLGRIVNRQLAEAMAREPDTDILSGRRFHGVSPEGMEKQ